MDELVGRVRALWAEVAGAELPGAGVRVVCAPGSRICPPGWVGTVTVAGAGLVTVPTEALLGPVRAAVDRHGIDGFAADLAVADTLGPAKLAYADHTTFRPAAPAPTAGATGRAAGAAGPGAGMASAGVQAWLGPVEWVDSDDPGLRVLLTGVEPAEADEAGIGAHPGRVAVLRVAGSVVAAADHSPWPAGTAHVGVLTAATHRGRGLAGVVASAVTADALAAGLLPQWRARVPASRRVAARLGYRTLGRQFSVLPGQGVPAGRPAAP